MPTRLHTHKLGKDTGQNERLERLEDAVWGEISTAASETAPSNGESDQTTAAAAAIETGVEDGVEQREGGAGERQRPKMKTLAKTVLLLGGVPLCPKVDTLQSQVRLGCIGLLRFRGGREAKEHGGA